MKKYETLSIEELEKICQSSESYREVATKIGYSPDGGSGIAAVKEMVDKYDLDISHFKGQSHKKNEGHFKTPIEQYLNSIVQITSHKLRVRILREEVLPKMCNKCGNTQWLGLDIPLELHHKDGNKDNNSLENLELLCPNCHYFTDTYKSKNWVR